MKTLALILLTATTALARPLLVSYEQLDERGHVGAYGIAYDPDKLTCATRLWPCWTVLRVTEIHNGISVIVTVTDKNPKGRFAADLSYKAFGKLAGHELGVAEVKIQVLKQPEARRAP